MQRKLFTVAISVVALHLGQALFVGRTPLGAFIANSLQIFAAVLAAVTCFAASRRGVGFTRLFWQVVGCSFLSWALGNIGWLYYEAFLNSEPPLGSMAYVLTDVRSLLLIMALILDQKEESDSLDVAALLDFVQLAIIYALIYLAWYYVPSLSESRLGYAWRSAGIEIGGHVAVIALGLVQAARARTQQIRRLYLTLVGFLGILAAGASVEAYHQLTLGQQLPTGSWLDLTWTGPFLGIAVWAKDWQPAPGFFPTIVKEKNVARTLVGNTVFALGPLIVLLQAAQLGQGWRRVSFSLLGISILCFAARLSLSELREFRSTVNANKANLKRLEAESKFRIAFEANPESITITILEDGKYLEANDVFVSTIGYEHSELVGKSALELGVWTDTQSRALLVEKLRRGERVTDWEARFRTKSGEERQMMLSAHPVQLEGQLCILSILHDVTEQRLLEQKLHQAQKMEAVGRLAGGVAHDFNNLLMITSGNLELLENWKQDPQRTDRCLQQIRTATDRGAALTRQMLAFSRQQVLSPSVLNLNAVINDLWKMLPRLLGEDIETVLSLDPNLGCVSADRGQVEQVIMNLAVNARDAMPQGGKLVVETLNVELNGSTIPGNSADAPSGPCVLLAVSDTGLGMSPAVQAQIFDPFFTTKERGKGTGLGLATVYGIVKQSSASISVSSEPGNGSTFKLYFPRVVEKERKAEPAPPGEPEPAASGTILLVEDETALRQVTSEFLRAKGYHVLGAENGEVALQICKSHTGTIDLLITDVVMPGHSGPNVAKQVTQRRPGVRMIFMSGYTDRTIASDFLGPNDAFFQKPFNLQALARKIQAMLIRES
jgi:two-component system cell cycle sensor histidine kinase/response regulator CckA